MTLPRQAIATFVLCVAFGASVPASADTVRGGRVVLLTSASQGGGDSVCQASPFNERACRRAERKYERTVDRIERQFDRKRDNLETKRDKKLGQADSPDEKDDIREDFQDDLAKLRKQRDKQLGDAQAEL
jgi:hypothetical protein